MTNHSGSPKVELEQLIVSKDTTILAALRSLDRGGVGTVLVCGPNRRLLALVTDGDVRRFILGGGDLSQPIHTMASTDFFAVAPEVDRSDVVSAMVERRFDVIPVVDSEGQLVHLHTFRETVLQSQVDSWAVVMAGGKGERLGDFTQALPKPMLPVGGRPILERIVRQLVSHGLRRIFLSVNYLAPMIEDHFGDGSAFHCQIEYLREEKPLGTGGALGLLPGRPTAPLVVMNGDLITELNFTRLLQFHRDGGYSMTVALREHRVRVAYGVAELDGYRVTGIVEKPSLKYQVNAGMYVVDPDLLDVIPKEVDYPITELMGHCLQQDAPVGGYRMDERWIDVGVPDEYARAQKSTSR